MRLIILTQYYPPEIGAPQRRLSELAQRFARAGHAVTVLTAMPNYPTGKIHEGYGGLVKREEQDGVHIIRTFIYPTQKASLISRLLNYFSFVVSSALLGTFMLRQADFLLVESPPLFLGLSALWLSWIKRARLVFNVSDLWPESAVRLGMVREGSLAHRISALLEKRFYQASWLVTGQSRSILSDIQARFPNSRTFHLSNGVDVNKFRSEYFDQTVRNRLGDRNKCIAVYAGLHGLAQGLSQVVEAADCLRHETDLDIVLIGDGPEKQALIKNVVRRGIPNLRFLDPVSAESVPQVLASADILVITLKSFIPGAVPSKLYEAMASGKPVVLAAVGEPAEIVQKYHAGIIVEPGDIAGLVKALRQLRDNQGLRADLGSNGRRAAEEDFSRERIVADFMAYLETNSR